MSKGLSRGSGLPELPSQPLQVGSMVQTLEGSVFPKGHWFWFPVQPLKYIAGCTETIVVSSGKGARGEEADEVMSCKPRAGPSCNPSQLLAAQDLNLPQELRWQNVPHCGLCLLSYRNRNPVLSLENKR